MKTYLFVNAIFYALFALWCTLRHETAASASGYARLDNSGHSEYLVVYGGLQWGVAAIFAWLGANSEYHRLGLLASLMLYAPIVAYRAITVLQFRPVSNITLATGALELGLLAAAVILWFTRNPLPDRR